MNKTGVDASFSFESPPNDEGPMAHADASAVESLQDDSSPLGLDKRDNSLALLSGGGAVNGEAGEDSYQTSILNPNTVIIGNQITVSELCSYLFVYSLIQFVYATLS